MSAKLVIILPAYNEEQTISDTLFTFHKEIPEAELWVINNNSSDRTAFLAHKTIAELGARGGVINEERQGKGNAVRRAFRDIEADFYILCDADLTYPAAQALDLLRPLERGEADMVVGDRRAEGRYNKENKRRFHNFGNLLVQFCVNSLFGAKLNDIMSGYRAFTREFVKNYPILVAGFEIETDMTLHALDKRFRIMEIPVKYRDRPVGSVSKLNTFGDGFRVLKTIAKILRHYKPLYFFGFCSLIFGISGIMAAIPVFIDYITNNYIYHIPLAVLATGLELIAMLMLSIGLILDSNSYYDKSNFERSLLNKKL